MGSKKRPTLKQMEKQAKKQAREKRSRSSAGSTSSIRDKKPAGIIPPDPKNPEILAEIKRLKVLTPYTVASRFNIRLSIARDFLEQLEERGIIKFVSRSRHLKIYTPAD
jgi:small subunit ribosomal protein S25e